MFKWMDKTDWIIFVIIIILTITIFTLIYITQEPLYSLALVFVPLIIFVYVVIMDDKRY